MMHSLTPRAQYKHLDKRISIAEDHFILLSFSRPANRPGRATSDPNKSLHTTFKLFNRAARHAEVDTVESKDEAVGVVKGYIRYRFAFCSDTAADAGRWRGPLSGQSAKCRGGEAACLLTGLVPDRGLPDRSDSKRSTTHASNTIVIRGNIRETATITMDIPTTTEETRPTATITRGSTAATTPERAIPAKSEAPGRANAIRQRTTGLRDALSTPSSPCLVSPHRIRTVRR
ncbi:unnamed protein product [Pieris brassicae]|uniref:Uncharacterized protein n=1 Tax=Pieris brassicae TaxID=7116 RepID=A0A9P0X6S1_PIEBR|nr:unnamed protein product [Pieris brassicae]